MTVPVAILAGGLGTRLGELATSTPKSLIDVAGSPFAAHQLALLRRHGFIDIVFCIGHLGDQIQAVIGDGGRYGVRVRYSDDGPKPVGTGGAIRRALPLLGEAFFILYGDSYLECDYQAIANAFFTSGRPGLMTVMPNDNQWDKSNVFFDGREIVRYSKTRTTPDMRHIDYGLTALTARTLQSYPADAPFDLARVFEDLAEMRQLAAYEVKSRFYEIGTPAGLDETRQHLSEAQ
jgi:NDP-sugar pyrophosphorylase family protein